MDSTKTELLWQSTQSGGFYRQPDALTDESVIRQCSAVILKDGYVARVGGFVLFQAPASGEGIYVGRIVEILADARVGKLLGLLIQIYSLGDATLPYQFPSLSKLDENPIFCKLKVCAWHIMAGNIIDYNFLSTVSRQLALSITVPHMDVA